jgi:hypothetical protein
MKKLLCTASFALAFFAAIPVSQVMANPSSSEICQQTMRPVTTGGAIREQLEATTKCKSQPSVNSQATQQSTPVTRAKMIINNQEQVSSSGNRSTPDTCSSFRATGTTGGSVRESLEAMARCRSGR